MVTSALARQGHARDLSEVLQKERSQSDHPDKHL